MVSEEKKRIVRELVEMINKSPVIAVCDFEGLPAREFQKIRRELRGKATIRVVKKTLARIALKDSGRKGAEKLIEHFGRHCALIFTKMNPFELWKVLESNKAPAPAKPGDVAPKDVIIPSGITDLTPGPVMTKLNRLGIKTSVRGGRVYIPEDVVVAKKGEVISAELAEVLKVLGVYPMEVSLKLNAALDEEGALYLPEVLKIDVEKVKGELEDAIRRAFNLAFNLAFVTPETAPALLLKAHVNALSLAVATHIPVKETLPLLIRKAAVHAEILRRRVETKS